MMRFLFAFLATSVFFMSATSALSEQAQSLDLTVWGTAGLDSLRPVSGGVPIAEGAAPEGTEFSLRDDEGKVVPCQTSVLSRWKDGSARWVLVDFQAAPPADGFLPFKLTWGKGGDVVQPETPATSSVAGAWWIDSGKVRVSQGERSLLQIAQRARIHLTLIDAEGRSCSAVLESTELEKAGGLQSTISLKGSFLAPDGDRLFGFRMRASVFAGLSKVFLEPMILVDSENGVVQKIQALNLRIDPLRPVETMEIGGTPGCKGQLGDGVRLVQVDDETYRFDGAEGEGSKAPGWAELSAGEGKLAVALRDFWQQWPKSIEASNQTLRIGLLPRFEAGEFDHMEPWYKHQYFFEQNCYRLRTGQARRWQVWLDLSGDGQSLAKLANAPLVPCVDPVQAIDTGVWGTIGAAGTAGMEEYDEWAENLFDNGYCKSIREQRDYGAMNWGDWWGERHCNWGNHEYDTPKHFFLQFARTGDPKYFYAGDTAARHMSEVDVIHAVNEDLRNYFEETLGGSSGYPTRPGMVHEHCVGHVSGFYPVDKIRALYVSLGIGKTKKPYLCLDPYNLGHIWTQGMAFQYFLTGDPWTKETIETIGDNLAQLVSDREFQHFKGGSHSGRVNGWTMLALAGAYELDPTNDRYLQAMKLLADDALSEQDPHCGGWLYQLPWGHCFCETKKHVGEAGFITSVRLNGLSKYYELTGDDRIPEAVKRGVSHLNNDTWLEQYSGWRYTSCPASSSGKGSQPGVTMMALVNGVKLGGDPEHLRILKKAWDAKFEVLKVAPASRPGLGKTYSSTIYGCPEAMNLFVNGIPGGE
jgi:exo-rhamnogalacturonan lyase-like protein